MQEHESDTDVANDRAAIQALFFGEMLPQTGQPVCISLGRCHSVSRIHYETHTLSDL